MAKLLVQQNAVATNLFGSRLCISCKGDGVQLWECSREQVGHCDDNPTVMYQTPCQTCSQTLVRSYPLGSMAALEGGSVLCGGAGTLNVIMSDSRTKEHFLVSCNSRQPPLRTLSETSPRIALPGPVHSAHALKPNRTGGSECVVVVLQSGDVAWMRSDAEAMQIIHVNSGGTKTAKAPKPKAAASELNQLAVLSASATSNASALVRLYAWNNAGKDSGSLALVHSITVVRPAASPSATAVDVRLAKTYALVTWSSGVVSILRLGAGGQVDVDCSEDSAANGPSSSSLTATANAASQLGSSKKRRPGQDDEKHQGSAPLVTPVDDTQFIVGYITPAAGATGGLALQFTLVDAQFGCSVSHGSVPLDSASLGTVNDSGAGKARLSGSLASPPGLLILELDGSVLSILLEVPRASLLSLVGRLSLQQPTASVVSAVQRDGSGTGAQAGSELPPGSTCSLDIAALSSAVAKGPSNTIGGLHVPLLIPFPADGPSVTSVRSVSQVHADLLRELEQSLVSSSTAAIDTGRSRNKVQPQQQLLQRALQTLLTPHPAGSPAPPSPPLALVVLLAQRLAEAGLWEGLGQLLASIPAGSGLPSSCSWLLPAAARAQQYRLLAPLCCRLEDLLPGDVVEALSVLLLPSTASNIEPRKAHYAFVRAHAEAAVSQSESRALAFHASERRDAVALARCAAAAIDSFNYGEVLLHSLLAVPMDAPELQGCLSRLNNHQVDRLLIYLAKWVDKYTQQLGDNTASVLLPQELLFPTLSQVIEWVRVILDAHLTRLLMPKGPQPCLDKLLGCLKLQVSACQHLLPLLGCAEHIQNKAPLPAAHVSAATQYTVELLDLSVRAAS